MSKPIQHAEASKRRYGGKSSDYISLHETMDSSKSSFSDNRHRIIFHSIFGTYIIQQMFGINYDKLEDLQKKYNLPDEFIKDYEKQREIDRATGTQLCNSEREYYCVRNVAEQHILEDYRMKFIPTLQDWVEQLPYQPWMNNAISVPARLQGSRETHTTDLTDFSTKTLD